MFLDTFLFCFFNRIMVLDAGKIVEFDTPKTLLNNKNSVFYSMAKDANLHPEKYM